MTVGLPELQRRPVTGRGNKISQSEMEFSDWLVANGWIIAGWECEEFYLPADKDKPFSWLRPDCKLARASRRSWPWSDRCRSVFLEHTDADEILSPEHLPELVRAHNLAKESGKSWISPRDYLEKKCSRIARAEKLHGVVIVLLPAMIRRQMAEDPKLLRRLIKLRRKDPAAYDELLFTLLPTYLLDELALPA
jgi:hypothetical protein